jgi:hypothetical protein
MILKPSLSFAGPREYRWQGLEVPAMMGKRRGTAQIAAASLGVCCHACCIFQAHIRGWWAVLHNWWFGHTSELIMNCPRYLLYHGTDIKELPLPSF